MKTPLVFLSTAVLVGSLAGPSFAAPEEASGAARPATFTRHVRLSIQGDPREAAALASALAELGGRLALELVDKDTQEATLATVLADVSGRAGASVAVQDGRTGEVRLLREVEDTGSRALLLDTVAHVVYGVLETMLKENERRSLPPRELPRELPRAPENALARPEASGGPVDGVLAPSLVAAAPPAAWGLEAAPFFGMRSWGAPGTSFSAESASGSAGLALGMGWRRGRLQPSLWLSAAYAPAVDISPLADAPAGRPFLRVQATTFSLAPFVNLWGGRLWLLQAGAQLVGDVVTLETLPSPSFGPPGQGGRPMGTASTLTSRRLDLVVGPILMARLALTPAAQVFVAAGAGYGPSYELLDGSAMSPSVRVPHTRLGACLGLSVTLGGASMSHER